ncbi:hypothetical protein ENC_32940 [Enterobacter hormaechei]|nr:hypothetical protein ENC_32940 [Enterobacter hormaechei]
MEIMTQMIPIDDESFA